MKEYLTDNLEHATKQNTTAWLEYWHLKQLKPEAFEVSDLIQIVLFEPHIPENISITTDFPNGLGRVYADIHQISQALFNLIINACQAMPAGGKLTVTGEQISLSDGENDDEVPADNQWIRIKISDTGEGIPPENMDKIFEPLFSTRPGNVGMGLPIVRKMVEANRGRIEVHSHLQKGSDFSIVLPIYSP